MSELPIVKASMIALVSLLGCGAPTEVRIVVDADPAVRSDARRLVIDVRGPDGLRAPVAPVVLGDGRTLPLVLPVRPRDGDAGRTFTLHAWLENDAGILVEQRARGGFVDGARTEMQVYFDALCASGTSCGTAERCEQGLCIDLCADAPPGDAACVSTTLLEAGAEHACLIEAGTIYCWGSDAASQLGIAEMGATGRAQPTAVSGGPWRTVSAGEAHTCAITASDELWCWGSNDALQLGRPGPGSAAPARIAPELAWRTVAAGAHHTCAIAIDGGLFCWGDGDNGKLGLGDTTARDQPARVGGAHWREVAPGGEHTCARRDDGAIWCWGSGSEGQVGSMESTSVPRQVGPATNWRRVTSGGTFSCALDADGALLCWGRCHYGECGIGHGGTMQPEPVRETTGQRWLAVSAGASHVCAIAADHTLWCWGTNDYRGVLGELDSLYGAEPTMVANGSRGWRELASGWLFSCATDAGGVRACWGRNDSGELGNGSTDDAVAPTAVQPAW